MTRSELMAEFDRREDARRHRQYIDELRQCRERVSDYAERRSMTSHRLACNKVVQAIDRLIAEAERAEV